MDDSRAAVSLTSGARYLPPRFPPAPPATGEAQPAPIPGPANILLPLVTRRYLEATGCYRLLTSLDAYSAAGRPTPGRLMDERARDEATLTRLFSGLRMEIMQGDLVPETELQALKLNLRRAARGTLATSNARVRHVQALRMLHHLAQLPYSEEGERLWVPPDTLFAVTPPRNFANQLLAHLQAECGRPATHANSASFERRLLWPLRCVVAAAAVGPSAQEA